MLLIIIITTKYLGESVRRNVWGNCVGCPRRGEMSGSPCRTTSLYV